MELQQQLHPWMHQEKFFKKQDSSELDNQTAQTATTASTSAFPSLNDDWTLSSFEKSVAQKNHVANKQVRDWSNLQLNTLKSMPSYLSFEKDSTATCPIQYTKKVLPRMLNLFRLLSLMVVYTNGSMYSEPYAICQDMDGVRFHVLLWRNNNKQNNHLELLVEVRYVGGESTLYHKRQYQYRILQSVHDSCDELTTEGSHVPTELSNLPIDPLLFNMKDREEQIAAQESLKRRIGDRISHDEQINVIVERIENYMCSEFVENVYEGLNILLNVTNANQSGFLVAETTSKKLLTGTSMTSKMTLSLGLAEYWYAEEELKNNDIRCDPTIIRDYSLLALRVIGQAVNFLDDESMQLFDINAETILKRDSFSSQSTLYQHIVHAEENPHFGYCAAHILARVCKKLSDIREEVQNDPECVPNIQKAVAFGLSNHISLELASKRLLSIVNTA
jgi:hypothetical protein